MQIQPLHGNDIQMAARMPPAIRIPASDIQPGQSISIPLHVFPIPTSDTDLATGAAGYKIGIAVELTNPKNSAEKTGRVMYEFDTGGQGFWADNTSGAITPAAGVAPITITYDSGETYEAVPTPVQVSFPDATVDLTTTVTVGLIKTVNGKQTLPIYGHFFGDFGAALQAFQKIQPDGVGPQSLLTVLSQLPAPYDTGFIVDLGPFPGSGEGDSPQLVVGLTDALRGRFTKELTMAKGLAYASPQTGAEIAAWQEVILQATVTAGNTVSQPVGVVFDTGAPTTKLHAGSALNQNNVPAPGEPFELNPVEDPSVAIISIIAGTVMSQNAVEIQTKAGPINSPSGYVNTGLIPFFNYPIMFDLTCGVIRLP